MGGVGLGLSFVLYLGYELTKEGLGESIIGYPGWDIGCKVLFGALPVWSLYGERFFGTC